jgi:hypothetical protein
MIDGRLGSIHERFHTPSAAVIGMGMMTALLALFGNSILIPITEVGSMVCASGWLAACSAYFLLERKPLQRVVATVGLFVAACLTGMKVLPFIPGHFTKNEWLALLVWAGLGLVLERKAPSVARAAVPSS